MLLFGRPVRDMIPTPIGSFSLHQSWKELLHHRERALKERICRGHEAWSEHTRPLPPLKVGDKCYVQNQTGNHPRRFDKTGMVVEVLQFDQYRLKMDGSGRITLRNRGFLRKYEPLLRSPSPLPPSPPPLVPDHAVDRPFPQEVVQQDQQQAQAQQQCPANRRCPNTCGV